MWRGVFPSKQRHLPRWRVIERCPLREGGTDLEQIEVPGSFPLEAEALTTVAGRFPLAVYSPEDSSPTLCCITHNDGVTLKRSDFAMSTC